MKKLTGLLFGLFLAVGSLSGCGDDSESFRCCINGAFYDCSNQEEFETCGAMDTKCTRAPTRDAECKSQ
jgi:hypothetical protein